MRYLLLIAGCGFYTAAAYIGGTARAESDAAEQRGARNDGPNSKRETNEPNRSASSSPAASPQPASAVAITPPAPLEAAPAGNAAQLVVPFAPGYITFERDTVADDIAAFVARTEDDLDCMVALRAYSAPDETGPRAMFLANRRLALVQSVVRGQGIPDRRLQVEPTPQTDPDGLFAHVELERLGDCR